MPEFMLIINIFLDFSTFDNDNSAKDLHFTNND